MVDFGIEIEVKKEIKMKKEIEGMKSNGKKPAKRKGGWSC